MHIERHTHLAVDRRQVVGRRDFLRAVSAGALAAGGLGFGDLVSLRADDLRRRHKACIVLWMQGGPSQFETFSPKPGHANGGPTKAISTAVPGIEVAEHFPRVASIISDVAILRSLTSKEGAHPRATFLMHTGYLPTASVKYPDFGSIVAQQIGPKELDLPAFVRIGQDGQLATGGGLLGTAFDPFIMGNGSGSPANAKLPTDAERYGRRLSLLGRLEAATAGEHVDHEVVDHQKLYTRAARMIQSVDMKAFDVTQEPESMRNAYGSGPFATGCLLARRLVEHQVPYVEVLLRGWDTHNDNFNATTKLAEAVDGPMAQLITDLKQRGMLEDTLVVWMGEFGRTPKINPRSGRDHYPRAFNVALAGGGVKGGRVIGATSAAGTDIEDRPIGVTDLFQTLCSSLGINPAIENMSPIGRPIKIVDGGSPVAELFS